MNRRKFLGSLGALGTGAAFSPSLLLADKAKRAPVTVSGGDEKPNILLIVTDQQHYHAVNALGNPFLRTPAMDRLVNEGVSVDNCYCSNPVCMPSRASLLTGRPCTETGVFINGSGQDSGAKMDRAIPNMGDWLHEKAGYDSIYAGKSHLNLSNTYDVPGFRVIAAGSEHRGDLPDMHVSRACEAYIRDYERNGREDPFLMVCNLVQPHDMCHWLNMNLENLEQPWYPGMTDVAPLPPIPFNFDFADGEPRDTRASRDANQPSRGKWNEAQWRYYLWNYYRQVEMVDAEVERMLTALDECGMAENTLVVLTTDHGEGMGEHRMVRKNYLYESATRVPLLARLPGRIPSGRRLPRTLASLIDLMPTFCDYAGVGIPDGIRHAISLKPAFAGEQHEPLREAVVVDENQGAFRGKTLERSGRQVRSERYSYIRYFHDANEMLFDLQSDPGELKNLAADPAYADVVEDHKRMLREWESKVQVHKHVPGPNPWPEFVG